jgi:REP element-mobilizing transposase RayT
MFMPRKPRIEYDGAVYHVMCRGDRQEAVFRDDRDCAVFLETLGESCERCGWRVHAYVLMGNHYHLLLETPEANLVAGMQWLQGTYTKRFNVRHRECGHLFQGRYKALPVASEGSYFSTVANYIHLNPARIRGYDFEKTTLESSVWSSYPAYLHKAKKADWLCLERVLAGFELDDTVGGRRKYRLLVEKRLLEMQYSEEPWKADEEWGKIRRGWCLGDESFRHEMGEILEGTLHTKKRESFSGEELRQHGEQMAERLIERGMGALGITKNALIEQPKGSAEKYALAWLVRKNTSVRNGWIKARLHMGTATNFSDRLRHVETAIKGKWGYDARLRIEIIKL